MKIIIKTPKSPKPRNPLALLARQRKGGSHDAHLTERHLRRMEKQALQRLIKGRVRDEDM